MNNTIQKIIFFVSGVAVGSIVTKIALTNKYNKLIDEQVEKETSSIKEIFERDKEKFDTMKKELREDRRDMKRKEVETYNNKVTSYGYSSEVTPSNRYKSYNDGPEIISSADYMDFEELGEYEREELTYYADGVLATTNGDEMITEQEADQTIGRDIFLHLRDHFGEYEDDPDVVHVKNDETMVMYEIFRDSRTYLEITEE